MGANTSNPERPGNSLQIGNSRLFSGLRNSTNPRKRGRHNGRGAVKEQDTVRQRPGQVYWGDLAWNLSLSGLGQESLLIIHGLRGQELWERRSKMGSYLRNHAFICQCLWQAAFLGSVAITSIADGQVIRFGNGYREWIADNPAKTSAEAGGLGSIPMGKYPRSAKIIGQDDRVRITDTTAYPWCTIGLVLSEVETAEGTLVYAGTGTMIGTKTVLTCAHNIVDDQEWVDKVTFIPGKNGDSEPYGQLSAVKLCAPEKFWQNEEDYDIAMMVLDKPIGNTTDYMRIEVESKELFEDAKLNTAGYAGDIDQCENLYRAFGYANGMLLGLIKHDMDSSYGQSGSPVWIYDSSMGIRSLVAVHVIGSPDYNVAVRISEELFGWINDYLKENDTVWYELPLDQASNGAPPAPPGCGSGAAGPLGLAALTLFGFSFTVRRCYSVNGRANCF
ncbi:MAG: hypothetical protein JSV03_13415 [Planctomycetota bacterium]|nr:MAG: hypothetical protein JSV03_13415 [Planctomycetota bacterium]